MHNQLRMAAIAAFAVTAFSGISWGAAHAQTTVQYDYDSLGRVCRARWAGGQTINYEYDANSNRRVVTQKTSGGVTNSAACPQVTASAAPASAARPRTNAPPSLPSGLNVTLCVLYYGSYSCGPQQVNVLRYAFDWDFQPVTVISTAMQSGPGTIAISPDGKSVKVTPPASAPNGTLAQAIFTISDGNGGTATSYLNITYVNY